MEYSSDYNPRDACLWGRGDNKELGNARLQMVVSTVGGQQGERQRLGQGSCSPVKEEAPIPAGFWGRPLGPPHLLLGTPCASPFLPKSHRPGSNPRP